MREKIKHALSSSCAFATSTSKQKTRVSNFVTNSFTTFQSILRKFQGSHRLQLPVQTSRLAGFGGWIGSLIFTLPRLSFDPDTPLIWLSAEAINFASSLQEKRGEKQKRERGEILS